MRFLGIDPGFARMGYGIIDKKASSYVYIASGTIETDAKIKMPFRLKKIYNKLKEIIILYKPNISGVEDLFFTTNQKTAIRVAEARGVAVLALVNAGLKIHEFTPLEVKQALTGYGKADKKQVEYMVKTILGIDIKEKLDDETDALAVAIAAGNTGII
jgi:crossover junction endodeoxyribonuclease RuvC